MAEPGISTQHLVAQLMVPMNRLLLDVNQALDTEIIDEDYNDQQSEVEVQAGSVTPSATGTGKVSAIQRHTMNSQQAGLASAQKEKNVYGLTNDTVPVTVPDGESSGKGNALPDRGSRPAVSPEASIVSGDEIRTVKQMRDNKNPVKSAKADAGQNISLQKRTESLTGISTVESRLPDTADNSPQNEDALAGGILSTQEPYLHHGTDEKINAEPVVALKLIRLRQRATKATVQDGGDMAAVASPAATGQSLVDKTGEESAPTMSAALASRSIQGQSGRITQSIDPVLERANQINNDAFDQDELRDGSEMMSASRVQNTFNVNVAMNQGSDPDREILQATLLDMLRTAARRQGLEV